MVMLFSLLPTTAWAADRATEIQKTEWEESYYVPSALNASEWEFRKAFTMVNCDLAYARYEKEIVDEDTGSLTYKYAYVIALDESSGSNYAIPDYSSGGAPWAQDDTMSEVYIEEGVTRIGSNAFANKNLLTLVEIPQTVTSIGESAFSGDLELRASADGKTPLDLSNVTSFGANAFANCNSLGGTGGVTLNTTSSEFTEIPDGLFTATYLKEIELNDNITRIGDNAFAHCLLSGMTTIDLPDSLVTIGDGAFTRQTDAPQRTITSLVIPEGVTTIGDHAFYNFTALETVTVLSKDLEKPGAAAFGDSQNNAFHKPGQIQVGDDVFEGTVGTTFLVPEDVDEGYIEMFESGYNCYLGDQSPMKRYPEGDIAANCTTAGRLAYEFTFLGYTDYYYQETPALGHDWGPDQTHEATCETDKYTYHYCQREGCDQGFDTTPQIIQTDVGTRTGHDYWYSYTENPAIADGTVTEFHYICQKENHSDTEDVSPKDYALVLNGKTLQATTLMSLSDLENALHAVGQGSNNVGVLDWNETDTTTLLTESGYYKVKFTPTNSTQFKGEVVSDGNGTPEEDGNGTDLTIYVEVSKVTLDFSQMSMYPLTQYVGDDFAPVQAEHMPDVTVGSAQYWSDDGGWSDTAPTLSDGNVGKDFKVRIPFTYNSTVYELPTTGMSQMPPSGYTLVKEGGQTWVETAFHIGKNEIKGTVSPIPNLRYTGEPQNTVSVTGIPAGSTVTFFVENGSDNWVQVGDPITTTTTNQIVTGAPMTNAGAQQVKVEITKENFVSQEVTVTGVIGKQLVATPKAATEQMSFTPISATEAKEFTGVADSSDDRYTVTDNKGTNAGTYTAKATLQDPDNYAWTTGDDDGDGTAEISWQILKRSVQKPTFSGGTYSYDGNAHPAVTVISAGDHATEYASDGTTLQAIYAPDGVSTGYVAYTATNARQTNAGTYEVTVSLQDSDNYRWSDGSAATYTAGTWKISQKVIYAPSVTAETITYDGQPYDGTIQLTHSENSSGILELGSNHQYFSGSAPLSDPPVNAGSYTVQPELVVAYGLISGNYNVLNIQSASFRIEKAPLTLTAPTEGLSVSYNGQQQSVPGVTVSGDLFGDDPSDDYTVMYTYSYTNTEGALVTSEATEEPPQLREIGTYTITATLTADNYQATPVTYEFKITTGTQSITLTPDDESRWTAAGETNPATYTVTLGETENFTVTGVGAVDPTAAITYEVTSGDAVSIDDASNPSVAVQKAGNATITVKAAATDKVGEATVTYNVVVEKGRAVIERGDISVLYDGSELELSDYAATVKKPVDSAPDPTEELTYAFFADAECSDEPIGTPKDAGVYYLKVSYPGDDNYIASDNVVKVTITAADLRVTAENVDKPYDGTAVTLGSLLTVNDAAGNPLTDATVVFVRSDAQPADWGSGVTEVRNVADSGTYWFKVTAKNHSEYIGSLTVAIKPIDIPITPTVTLEKVYDGNADAAIMAINGTDYTGAEIGLTGTADGESISVTATAAYNDKTAADGKTITVTYTLTGADLDNYTFNGEKAVEGKVTGTLTDGKITKKPITVTGGIDATDRVYDSTTEIALTGKPTADGFVGSDDVSFKDISTETGTVMDASVGDNKPVTVTADTLNSLLTGDDAGNYTVSDDYTGARVNITARPVYLQFPGQTTEPWVREVAYTPAGLTSRPEVYQVSAKAKDDASGFVGDDHLADGDIAYSFVGADNKPETNPTNLGTYTVKAELTDTAATKFSNYTISPVTGTIKIVKNSEALSVIITPASDLVYTGLGQDPIASITVMGGNETLTEGVGYNISYSLENDGTYTLNRAKLTAAIKDAGTYTVYWEVTTTNYGDQTGSFDVKVERATLDLSRDVTDTRAYNGTVSAANQVTGVGLTGQQKGESITVSVTSAVYDQAIVGERSITITYAITAAEGVSLNNYKVSIAGAEAKDAQTSMTETVTAKITRAPVTVTINNQTAVYDGTTPDVAQVQGTNWEVTEGKIFELTPDTPDELGITLSIPDNAKNAGTYDINGRASNGNYAVTFAGEDGGTSGKFTITPREIAVTIGSASGIYGDTPNLSSVTLTGTNMVSGESTELFRDLISTTATNTSDVGEYDITADNGIHGNYNITFTSGTYTVEKRPITITIADKSSAYGCELAKLGWKDAYTGDDSKSGIVNDDNLGIVLTTDAPADADTGSYPITGTASGEKTSNYTITWAGSWNQEDENKGTAGTYTITKATLTIAFTRSTFNVSMGNLVDNPLKYINSSNSDEELSGKPADVTVQYESSDDTVATVDPNTGEVTILQPGDATITATVTDGGQNFTDGATSRYELRIATAGAGIQVQAKPNNHLVYNGAMQQLLEDYTVTPSSASVTFTVTALESGDQCEIDDGMPAALDAGTYRVSWTASLTGYTEVTGEVEVTIDKADPSTGFSPATVQTSYAENKIFDSTVATTLNVADDYEDDGGSIIYLSDNTAVAKVNNNDPTNISINATGTAVIRAQFTETDNYKAQTVSFTLEVTDAETTIRYEAADYEVKYDGWPHGADITVTSPSNYTILYSNDGGYSYNLTESPVITNVEEGPITIHFQIQAPGYKSVSGTQTVTVKPKEITSGMISGIAESYTYTGQDIIVHTLQVADSRTLLDEDDDYDVEYEDNREVGRASVTITGKGNYTGSVTVHFEITAVESSYLSASLDRYFGFYDDEDTNSATVTVMHGDHAVTEGVSISVSGAEDDVSIVDQTITFLEPGVYEIEVEVTGSHSGTFTLYYTLLPQSGGDFEITGLDDTIVTYDGKNHAFEPEVSYEGTPLTEADYALTYSYTPFSGSGVEDIYYNPASTEMTEAGLYVVTVTGEESYGGTGTVVLLIAQRDLADSAVDADIPDATYDGSEQEPEVTLTFNGENVGDLNATEYYYNIDAGEALAVSSAAAGNNNFSGTRVDTFRIDPKELNAYDFTAVADPDEYNYTGSVVTPEVIVTDIDTGDVLVAGRDYTVDSEAVEPGEHTADVIGRGNYTGTVPVDFTILAEIDPPPVAEFDLTVTPESWTYTPVPQADISVTFNDRPVEESGYTLTVERDGNVLLVDGTNEQAVAAILEPGEYAITATGTGVYAGYSDTDTVSVRKIRTAVTVTADPDSLVGGGTVTLTLSGQDLPGDAYLPDLLTVSTENGTQLDLDQLLWVQSGSQWTASFTAADASETYTFTLTYPGDSRYEAASDSTDVVTRPTGGDPGEGEEYIIRASAGTGGSISPSGRISVAEGDSQRFVIEADDGYEIADVRVDGESIGARSRYTFTDVDDDHTIRATFEWVGDSDKPDEKPDPKPDPDDNSDDTDEGDSGSGGVADPDDTGVANWLNTTEHVRYLNGYDTGMFMPGANMTRAEVAQMFYNLLLNKNVPITVSFTDVPATAWYADAVNVLASLGILTGYGNNQYAPDRPITRAEFTVIAMRFAQLNPGGVNIFSDVDADDWFYAQVVGSIQYGWITGYADGTFRPNAYITRAEVTAIVNRMLGRVADQAYVDSNTLYLKQFADVSRFYWGYYDIMEATNAHAYSMVDGTEAWLWLQ